MESGADPLWVNDDKQNLVHPSIYHRKVNIAVLELLLKYGVNIAVKDVGSRSVIYHGAIHRLLSKELIEFLKENDVLHVHDKDSTSKIALDYAEEQESRQ